MKIPYTPSETKRYEISPDEYSRRRITALRDIHHSLESALRIPLSFCIIGSLVKGKTLTPDTAEYADIDMSIFFDEEALRNKPITERELVNLIQDNLRIKLEKQKEALGLKEVSMKHVSVRPINSGSIQKTIDSKRYRPGAAPDMNLSKFFTLSIGETVKKYRQEFLRKLATMEDQEKAERIWNSVRESVEKAERGNNIPNSIKDRFPQTLADALKFYGVRN